MRIEARQLFEQESDDLTDAKKNNTANPVGATHYKYPLMSSHGFLLHSTSRRVIFWIFNIIYIIFRYVAAGNKILVTLYLEEIW